MRHQKCRSSYRTTKSSDKYTLYISSIKILPRSCSIFSYFYPKFVRVSLEAIWLNASIKFFCKYILYTYPILKLSGKEKSIDWVNLLSDISYLDVSNKINKGTQNHRSSHTSISCYGRYWMLFWYFLLFLLMLS